MYRLLHWNCPVPWVPTAPQRDHVQFCAFGATLANNVVEWLQTLVWPSEVQEDDLGVTYVELAASWMLFSGIPVPCKRKDSEGKEHLVCCPDFATAAAYNVSFQELSSNFATLLNQIQSLTDQPRFPPERCQVKSLYMLGPIFFSQGLRRRPMLPDQENLVNLLTTYVRANPKCYKPLPPLTLIPKLSAAVVKDEVKSGWAYMANRAHRYSRAMIKWRKEAQWLSFGLTPNTGVTFFEQCLSPPTGKGGPLNSRKRDDCKFDYTLVLSIFQMAKRTTNKKCIQTLFSVEKSGRTDFQLQDAALIADVQIQDCLIVGASQGTPLWLLSHGFRLLSHVDFEIFERKLTFPWVFIAEFDCRFYICVSNNTSICLARPLRFLQASQDWQVLQEKRLNLFPFRVFFDRAEMLGVKNTMWKTSGCVINW